MTFARYTGAFVLSFATAFLAWVAVVDVHPMFSQLSVAGLVPWFVAGLLGGFIAGLLAPQHKIIVALVAGALITAVLVRFLLRHGFSHAGRDPFLWYAPIYLVPTFPLGGYLSRRLWLSPNTSLERTRGR